MCMSRLYELCVRVTIRMSKLKFVGKLDRKKRQNMTQGSPSEILFVAET